MEMKTALFICIFLALTGCNRSGYRDPGIPMPPAYSEEQTEQTEALDDEEFLQWWGKFNDPFLNALLEETIENNFDLTIALEQVYQARAQYWVQFTQILPEFDFDAQGSRYRTSQAFASAAAAQTAAKANAIDCFHSFRRFPHSKFFPAGF